MHKVIYSKELSDIVDVSMRSTAAKTEICIFELKSLDTLIGLRTAEEVRQGFLKNNVKVRQLTNLDKLNSWTKQEEFAHNNLLIRHITPEIFRIENEILIFDDTVAIYRAKPDVFYMEISDSSYATAMRQLFESIWQIADSMIMGAGGSAHTGQYMPLNLTYNKLPVVVYPAHDDGDITKVFNRSQPGEIEKYVQRALRVHKQFTRDADMLICYVWNEGTTPMLDVWKVQRNTISDDSGFLYDALSLRNLEPCNDVGVSSGNSLVAFTAEELLLRQLILDKNKTFQQAAQRQEYMPKFPLGFSPTEPFYLSAT